MTPMHISVAGYDVALNPQTRAYAEYRVFSTLARHADQIDAVRVVVAAAPPGASDDAVCVIEVDLRSGDAVRAKERASHSYSAVDSAAESIFEMMQRRGRDAVST